MFYNNIEWSFAYPILLIMIDSAAYFADSTLIDIVCSTAGRLVCVCESLSFCGPPEPADVLDLPKPLTLPRLLSAVYFLSKLKHNSLQRPKVSPLFTQHMVSPLYQGFLSICQPEVGLRSCFWCLRQDLRLAYVEETGESQHGRWDLCKSAEGWHGERIKQEQCFSVPVLKTWNGHDLTLTVWHKVAGILFRVWFYGGTKWLNVLANCSQAL